jgi:hypothetical protein
MLMLSVVAEFKTTQSPTVRQPIGRGYGVKVGESALGVVREAVTVVDDGAELLPAQEVVVIVMVGMPVEDVDDEYVGLLVVVKGEEAVFDDEVVVVNVDVGIGVGVGIAFVAVAFV